jgi:dihydroxy-acid dehydratase
MSERSEIDGGVLGSDTTAGFISRAFLRGGGLSAAEVRRRPVIGICTSWSELNPCNLGLRDIAAAVKGGVTAAGGLAFEFPTISLAEPFVHPTTMLLRNLMAMDVEEMIRASPIDAVVLLNGCDKTVPAQLMGAISADKPAVSLGAGHRPAGCWRGDPVTIDDLWGFVDQRRVGNIDDPAWVDLEGCLNPGIGTCNVMGTAVTMAVMAEVLGFAMPGTALLPATSAARLAAAEGAGKRAVALAGHGPRPSEILNPQSLENAFRVLCATGGATNAVIHLQAFAGRAGIHLTLDTLRQWSDSTPLIADVRPSGPNLLEDLQVLGAVPALVAMLAPLLHVDQQTADGRTWGQVVEASRPVSGPALRTLEAPKERHGAIAIISGSLAPRGAVIKRSAAEERLLTHRGPAIVFNGVQDMQARIDDPQLNATADSVLILRGVGPIGGPGMPEVGGIPIPAYLLRAGVRDMLRISDARMSGTASGAVVLHVTPEAAAGGPLARVQDGDMVELDVAAGRLDLLVPPLELAARQPGLTPPEAPTRGYQRLHHDHVLQADYGCDYDFLTARVDPQGRP